MNPRTDLTRRQFLKLSGAGLAAAALPTRWLEEVDGSAWPTLELARLPAAVQEIFLRMPQAAVDRDGYLVLSDQDGRYLGRAPQARTQWNLEHTRRVDRLYSHVPWGIVLHWYGDKENFDRTVRGYLRGFDSLREVEDLMIRTSAHFVVGDEAPLPMGRARRDAIGILQTQAPDRDGTPFLGSHLRPLDITGHKDEHKQYFVRALYQLGREEPGARSLLQDFFDGPVMDPNLRTIAIEVCGWDFESPEHAPGDQKIANTLVLVCALMKRYSIPASGLLGHHEIQLGKPDPGKKFMALIRYLVGVKALLDPDEHFKRLVFGPFAGIEVQRVEAVRRYFAFTRDYMTLTATARRVYEWEARSKFWFLYDTLAAGLPGLAVASSLEMPVAGPIAGRRYDFLSPENHEGTDLYAGKPGASGRSYVSTPVQLIADGLCLYVGDAAGCQHGQSAIFRHRQPDGAEILSVFGHLSALGDVRPGQRYPAGYQVGAVEVDTLHRDPFLHFAVAYGATWDTDLSRRPSLPLNAGLNWIQDRYLHPLDYLLGPASR